MFGILLRLLRRLFAPVPVGELPEAPPDDYRHAAIVPASRPRAAPVAEPPVVLWAFTRVCPICGVNLIDGYKAAIVSKACGQTKHRRIREGWFRRCSVPGVHLHQSCRGCNAEWLSVPPPAVGAPR